MLEASQRRNPLRLIVNKETQLRILWLVWGAVFFCMALAAAMVQFQLQWFWIIAVSVAVGLIASLWVSRQIAGPLYRIEKDLRSLLYGAVTNGRVQIREGDQLQNLATLVNQLIDKTHKN